MKGCFFIGGEMAARDFQRMIAGEARHDVRVGENTRLLWHIKEGGLAGEGRVRNISSSGMLVELTSVHTIPEESILSFDSNPNEANYIPQAGRLVWQRRKRFAGDTRLCGVQFTDVPEVILSRLGKRIDDGVQALVRMWKITNVVGRFASVVAIALIVYSGWLGWVIYQGTAQSADKLLGNSSDQAALTREYQRLYTDTTHRLTDVTLELNQTTALYQQSQQVLQSSQQELVVLKSVLSQTETMLAQAQSQNTRNVQGSDAAVRQDMNALKPALNDPVTADIRDIPAGKTLIALYQDKIQAVRAQIDQIRRDEQAGRITALRERDRVRLMLGNQGYFVRDGRDIQVNMAQYRAANPNAAGGYSGQTPQSDSRVKVNVTVFQQ
ncbi:MAG: PilZ domain-containing protein [Candidatus Omnitrophica bacterium]|nr:PilZ domain-containing protein [Candidatus Omnitrophota bacterium]